LRSQAARFGIPFGLAMENFISSKCAGTVTQSPGRSTHYFRRNGGQKAQAHPGCSRGGWEEDCE